MNKRMKKYKRIVPFLLVCAAAAAVISACAANGNNSSSGMQSDTVSDSVQSAITDGTDISSQQPGDENANVSVAQRLRQSIADAYGENYLPNMSMSEELLESEFGLSRDMYDDIIAEMPTVGFHPDRLIILKPKQGRENEVKQALETARETLAEDSVQYPVNAAKVNAAKVLEHDGYYCFMLLGKPDDLSEDEEQAAQFADEQISIGVKAFEDFFTENQ